MGKALEKQVGGDHYKQMKIQPMEFSMANNLNACQHTAIKYICRYKHKGGKEDIKKAIHTLELLKEIEYGTKVQANSNKCRPICPECEKPKEKVSEFMQGEGYPEYICPEHYCRKGTIKGFGNEWSDVCPECNKKTIQVIRPGKVQCSECG